MTRVYAYALRAHAKYLQNVPMTSYMRMRAHAENELWRQQLAS